ncbi:MAG: M23 family metallopeptidase [Chloroflexota bacterium]
MPDIRLESRPETIIAAKYEPATLPFPNIGARQEIVFDLGITLHEGHIHITGLILKGVHGHQLLFEQRWTAQMLMQHTGESDLEIEAGMGLAVRCLHVLHHAHQPLTEVEVVVLSATIGSDETHQNSLTIPVRFHEQKTDLHFPLRGAWWAIQASDWSDQHKIEAFSQTYALDFVKLGENNQIYKNEGLTLEDHYSWDQPVYATAGGKVAHVFYDMPDLTPGIPPNPLMFRDDARRVLGNAVAISHANGEFSYYGHLQQASIQVNVGDLIKRGTLLGKVGNSGHSPGPHLHFHMMEGPNLFFDQGLPVQFSHFSAGGQRFDQLTTIPTRMIVHG